MRALYLARQRAIIRPLLIQFGPIYVPLALQYNRIALPALILACTGVDAETPEQDTHKTAENLDGKSISSISIQRQNVFDPSDPKENKSLYRFVNRMHIVTRESVIVNQLLVKPGDTFDPRLADESERILRSNKYLYDASIKSRQNADGTVDLAVLTRDVWTLNPDLVLTRSGGENKTVIGIQESNLLGKGQRILINRSDDVDRTSTRFEFSDRQIGKSWVSVDLRLADNSDGHSTSLSVHKPFHSLDSHWAAGGILFDDDRRSVLYDLGEETAEYQHQRRFYSANAGWSTGLQGRWVRRWNVGAVYDENRFSSVPAPQLSAVIPANRTLVYPFVGVEILEDRFEKTTNGNQINRAEDFYLGTRLAATLGWSGTSFGADRDAAIYSLTGSRSFGNLDDKALFVLANVSGRHENGETANATTRLDFRYYWRQSSKQLFFAVLDATAGHQLDLDNPVLVGGDSGLRGYPLRYQSGDSRMVLSVEQRYYTDWYPFRLFRVGAAAFVDVGRTWGNNPLGSESLGWLKDVGIGLRLAPTRIGSRKVVHIDLAFPLDGDNSIDSVQILFELKSGF